MKPKKDNNNDINRVDTNNENIEKNQSQNHDIVILNSLIFDVNDPTIVNVFDIIYDNNYFKKEENKEKNKHEFRGHQMEILYEAIENDCDTHHIYISDFSSDT